MITGQRLGDTRAPGLIDRERRIKHTKRIEQSLFFKFIKRFSRNDLDDAAENVGRMPIVPQRARLFGERQFCESFGELRVVEIAVEQAAFRIELSNRAVAIKPVRDAGGVP